MEYRQSPQKPLVSILERKFTASRYRGIECDGGYIVRYRPEYDDHEEIKTPCLLVVPGVQSPPIQDHHHQYEESPHQVTLFGFVALDGTNRSGKYMGQTYTEDY